MTDIKVKPLTDHQLAVRILALDEEENIESWIEKWDPEFEEWGSQDHSGDCTKQPWSCFRCIYDDAMKRVPDYRRILSVIDPSSITALIEEVRAQEREACAQVALGEGFQGFPTPLRKAISDAIRARGQEGAQQHPDDQSDDIQSLIYAFFVVSYDKVKGGAE